MYKSKLKKELDTAIATGKEEVSPKFIISKAIYDVLLFRKLRS